MTTLVVAELELRETPPSFFWIVVRDCSLEALAQRRRLPQLAAEPAEKTDCVRARHSRLR
jgi:hypothetical protein